MKAKGQSLVPAGRIESAILFFRKQKVILDRDLAALYGVETRSLIQAVKRNSRRFPADFMFQLSKGELAKWRSHFVMSNPSARMSLRRRPFAFTEQGVAMLSGVLNSVRAIEVNIEVIRAFIRLRAILASHADLASRLDGLERKYDVQFKVVFDAIRKLMAAPPPGRKARIGFRSPADGRRAP
jgi:hypothetical protein